MNFHIYPSIVSTNGKWKNQIEEVKKFKLNEICLFPTCLPKKKRYLLYRQLAKTSVKHIPLVHLRHDMDKAELDYLTRLFSVNFFNLHSQLHSRFLLRDDLTKYKNQILIENTLSSLIREGKNYPGLCLDTAHLENQRLQKSRLYTDWIQAIKKYPIKVVHISAVKNKKRKLTSSYSTYDAHCFDSLQEFNYLQRYRQYLPRICALELENSIEKQLCAKEYIEQLLLI